MRSAAHGTSAATNTNGAARSYRMHPSRRAITTAATSSIPAAVDRLLDEEHTSKPKKRTGLKTCCPKCDCDNPAGPTHDDPQWSCPECGHTWGKLDEDISDASSSMVPAVSVKAITRGKQFNLLVRPEDKEIVLRYLQEEQCIFWVFGHHE